MNIKKITESRIFLPLVILGIIIAFNVIFNKNFFNISPEIQKGLIHIGLEDKNPYMKYPKSTKLEENKI